MKRIFISMILFCIICASGPIMAQTTTDKSDQPVKFAGAGLAFNQYSTPALMGYGFFALPISTRVVSYTDYDVTALPGVRLAGQKFAIPKIQYSIRTGFAIHVYDIAKGVSLWGLGSAGLAASGETTGSSFGGGGFVDVALGKGWGILGILQVDKNSVTGPQFTPRIGFRKQL